MINWALLEPRNLVTVALFCAVAIFVYSRFAKKETA